MTEPRVVVVSREIAATPEAVFQALTHPLDLSYWFCHLAWTEPKPGGDFQVRWRNGWWARGVYQMVERPRRVEFTWQGKDEPGETTVVFGVETLDQGTAVTVKHGGFGADTLWDKAVHEAESSWPRALENLESVLLTGIDLREASRPMLGIVPEELTPERAAREGISTDRGVYLATVLDDGGAAEAGLKQGDVITSIGGMAVPDGNSLSTTLAPYRAGERVQVTFVRGAERGVLAVELKRRPMPEIPFDPRQVGEQVRERRVAVLAELRELLTGVSEEEAGQNASGDEWSIKETLAHLSTSERFAQRWLADIIVGTTPGPYGGKPTAAPELLAMALSAAPTVGALLARLEQDMEETLALFAALRPEIVAMKGRYRAMASSLLVDFHVRDHVEQIREIVNTIKGQLSGRA